MECHEHECQICKFIHQSQCSVISSVSVSDVLQGRVPMPFCNPNTWKSTQHDCNDLRRTYAHLSQGTRPGKKATNITDVKRYLRVASVGRDGLLIVKQAVPFRRTQNLTIVPQHVLSGLLTALHLQFEHPTASQLTLAFNRYFYGLDSEAEIKSLTSSCSHCAALKQLPKEVEEFSTSAPPSCPGTAFACDIMCRAQQKVMVIRDTFSSFTIAKIVTDEKTDTLRNAMLECTAELKSKSGASIRVDGATGMQSLKEDSVLAKHGLQIEVGRLKNKNKNPIAEKAIQELQVEIK